VMRGHSGSQAQQAPHDVHVEEGAGSDIVCRQGSVGDGGQMQNEAAPLGSGLVP
jgi:hypothetical protein